MGGARRRARGAPTARSARCWRACAASTCARSKTLAATARRDVVRARKVVRPQPHGGGSETTPVPPAPPAPSLAAGATLSVAATAYSLPGHTASGLPVGAGHLRHRSARDPARHALRRARLRHAAWPPTPARPWSARRSTSGCRTRGRPCTGGRPLPSRSVDAANAPTPARARVPRLALVPVSTAGGTRRRAGRRARARDREGARRARPRRHGHGRRRRRPRDRRDHLPPQRLAPARAGLDREALHDGRRAQHAAARTSASRRRSSASARASGATWRGDLYLVGSGDPTFSSSDIAGAGRPGAGARHPPRSAGASAATRRSSTRARWGPWPTRYIGVESPPLSGLALDRDVNPDGREVASPARSAARALRRALAAAGVQVGVRFVGGGRAPKGALRRSRARSPMPLWRIVRFMDRHSDNFTAEMVAKAIGAYAGGSGSTARGMRVDRRGGRADARRRRRARAPRGRLGPLARQPHDGERARSPARRRRRRIPRSRSRSPTRSASSAPTARSHAACPSCAAACSARAARSTTSRRSRATSRARAGAASRSPCSSTRRGLSDWNAHGAQDAIVKLLAKR